MGSTIYRITLLPSAYHRRMKSFLALELPREIYHSKELIKKPPYLPLYADLYHLHQALFAVGTEDALLDDNILM